MKIRKIFLAGMVGIMMTAAGQTGVWAATRGAVVVPRLRSDRLAVMINFSSFDNIASVAYCLTYSSNGRRQGACGNIYPSGQSVISRELLLGTCSRGVCTFFPNVKDMRLVVRSTLKTDHPKYVLRSFRFRI